MQGRLELQSDAESSLEGCSPFMSPYWLFQSIDSNEALKWLR